MAFDPRWQPPPLQIQPSNLNSNHQPPLHYNLPIQNPRSEATATIPAVAGQNFHYSQGASIANPEQFSLPEAVAAGVQHQPYHYYQQGVAANSFSSTGFPSAGQYCYRGETVPVASPLIIPQEWNNTHRGESKKRMKKGKAVQPLQCVVCKIFCDTQEVLNFHKQGKQHKKNLQRLKDAITPKPKEVHLTLNESENEERGEKEPEKNETEKNETEKNEPEKNEPEQIPEGWNKAQPVHCKVCDVYCNTAEFLRRHEAGRKHIKSVGKLKAAAEIGTEEVKETKPYVEAQPAYCQICNILCSREEDLEIHYKGKNHNKKVKETKPYVEAQPAYCQICNILCTNQKGLEIHYKGKNHNKRAKIQEVYNLKPEGNQTVMGDNENSNQMKRKATDIDLTKKKKKKKKRKALGCDDKPMETKIRCDLCNIEVNSQIVYASHLAGYKHAAKVKMLHDSQVGYGFQQPVTEVADKENTQH